MREAAIGRPREAPVATLNDLCEVDPEVLRETTPRDYRFKYIDIGSVSPHSVAEDLQELTFAEAPSRARKKVRAEDVLMATVRPNLKAFARLRGDARDVVASTGFAVLRAREGVSDPRFIEQVLFSDAIERQVDMLVAGSNYPAITVGNVRRLRVPAPGLPEQERIAEILCALDDQIACTQKEAFKRRQRLRGLEEELLSCTNLGAAAGEFLLRDLIPEVQYGISTSLDSKGVIPVLRMNNLCGGEVDVTDLKFSRTDVSDDLLLRDGDVLFNRTNSMEHVGRTSIWRGQLERATFASYLVRLVADTSRILKPFLVHLLSWQQNQTQMRRYATPGVQQVNINPTSLRRCRVVVPLQLNTQQRISDVLDACHEEVRQLDGEAEKLRLKKSALMQALLPKDAPSE